MGTQRKHERMPLPLANVPKHDIPLWDTRASVAANERRTVRDAYSKLSGADLTKVLDSMRVAYSDRLSYSDIAAYRLAVLYRAALNEAVVARHWTVEWSDLTNTHTVR